MKFISNYEKENKKNKMDDFKTSCPTLHLKYNRISRLSKRRYEKVFYKEEKDK